MKFYDLQVNTPSGDVLKMSEYKNKAVLIVNTATKCGFTPQLIGLEELHEKYGHEGLVVLGFPCNQFGSQEPETNETVEDVCKINYGVDFQLTEKVEVNGSNAHPIFKFLKEELGGFLGDKIKWNFTKFLITPQGLPFKRYAPTTKPSSIEKDILSMLDVEVKPT